jgi:hypothetical protein
MLQLLYPVHHLLDRPVLPRIRALQCRSQRLHCFDVPLQRVADRSQSRELPLKAANVPLAL